MADEENPEIPPNAPPVDPPPQEPETPKISDDQAALVIAIAKANRHPNPEWWLERVKGAYEGTPMPD